VNGGKVGYRDENVGHVYVMLNPAMPGVVKIGRTRDQTKARARQLYSTGVPKEFIVLWQEVVHHSDKVEREVHKRFKDLRVNPRREFFKVEPQQAIRTLMEVAGPYFFDLSEKSRRIAITDELRTKLGADMRSDIAAVNVAEAELGGMFLEVVRVPSDRKNKKQLIDYVDLDVLGDAFTFRQTLNAVAKKLVGLDPLTIAMVTDLLTDDAGRRLWDESQGKEK
jgi:T5orf172 domain-containing protein